MSAFAGRPFVCEYYADTESGWARRVCPFPNPAYDSSIESWESDHAGLRCPGNNDADCAAAGTPLTAEVFNTVLALLSRGGQAENLDSVGRLAACSYALTSLKAVVKGECSGEDFRSDYLAAWIALTAAASAVTLLFVALMAYHWVMTPDGAILAGQASFMGHTTGRRAPSLPLELRRSLLLEVAAKQTGRGTLAVIQWARHDAGSALGADCGGADCGGQLTLCR